MITIEGANKMECTTAVTLTNMCMIYDDNGNVLVQEKIRNF
ncbi:MAG: hypothetical protein R3Y54_13475 [Eubacteriales bacterium]